MYNDLGGGEVEIAIMGLGSIEKLGGGLHSIAI